MSFPLNYKPYYYRFKFNNIKIDSLKAQIKKEINISFQKIKLNIFLLLSKYLDTYINLADLENEFENLSLEYLAIEIKKEKDEKLIKLSFKLDIYKEIFDESIKGLLKIENIKLSFNLDREEENKGKFGINFEDIIIEQLWNNMFKFVNFPKNNKIKINDIFN